MVLIAGANVVRFAPSLVITEQDIIDGLQGLERAIADLVATQNQLNRARRTLEKSAQTSTFM